MPTDAKGADAHTEARKDTKGVAHDVSLAFAPFRMRGGAPLCLCVFALKYIFALKINILCQINSEFNAVF